MSVPGSKSIAGLGGSSMRFVWFADLDTMKGEVL